MHTDNEGRVISCDRDGGDQGWRLYSVSKWNANDSAMLGELVEKEFENKNYDIYWDDVPMFIYADKFNLSVHKINKEDIVEIDSIEELADIDSSYKKYVK